VSYRVELFLNAAETLRHAGAHLEARPAEHNLILTLLKQRADSGDAGRYWIVRQESGVAGVVVQSPLTFIAALSPMGPDAARRAAGVIARSGVPLPGVQGDAATAAAFAGHWAEVSHAVARPVLGARLCRLEQLDDLVEPEATNGRPRRADQKDLSLVTEWFDAFAREVGETRADPAAVARRVAGQQVSLWEAAGRPVCLVARSQPSAGMARIGPVYTPEAERRRGYAAACVSWVSRELLEAGHGCVLYTDLANPTSNSVYRALGYRAIAELVRYEFGDPVAAADTKALPLRSTATQ
jgi:predicted GNAT family acetyltransferase